MKNVNRVWKLQGTDTLYSPWVMLSLMICSPCSVYSIFEVSQFYAQKVFSFYLVIFLCSSVLLVFFSNCYDQWYFVLTGSFCLLLIYGV